MLATERSAGDNMFRTGVKVRGIVQNMSHLNTTWASRKTAPLSRVRETEKSPK